MRALVRQILHDQFQRNVVWIGLDLGCRAGLGALVTVLLARELGPSDFGDYIYVLALVATPLAMCSLGLNPVLKRRFSEEAERGRSIFWGATLARLAAGLAAALAVASYVRLSGRSELAMLLYVASISFLQPALGVGDQRLHAAGRSSVVAKWRLSVYAASLAAFGIGLWLKMPVWYYLTVYVADLVAASAGLWTMSALGFRDHDDSFHWSVVGQLVGHGKYVLLASFATSLSMQADIFVARFLFNDEQLGVYGVATRLTRIFFSFGMVFVTAYFPSFMQSQENERKQAEFYALNVAAGAGVGLVAVLIGPALIGAVFGEAYANAAEIWRLHAWTCLGYLMLGSSSPFIARIGKFHLTAAIAILLLVTNFALSFLFAYRFGLWGNAFGFALSYLLVGIGASWLFPDLRPHARAQLRALRAPWKALKPRRFSNGVA